MKARHKISLIIICPIIGLMLLIWLVGSPIAKNIIEKNSEQWFGREVTIGSIQINPFVGSVNIEDFRCSENNDMRLSMPDSLQDNYFVKFNKLYVSCNLIQLLFKDLHIRHIKLEDFEGEILKQDTAFNFTDIIARFSSKDSVEQPRDSSQSSWKIRLDDISLLNGNMTYIDLKTKQIQTIENINLIIPGLYFGNKQSDAGLSLDLPDNGGHINMFAAYNIATNNYSLTFDLEAINTNLFLPFLQKKVNIRSLDAMMDGRLFASGNLNNLLGVKIKGNLMLEGLDMRNMDKETIAEIDSLAVNINHIEPQTMNISLDSIMIDGLRINYLREKDYTTLSRLLGVNDTTEFEDPLPEELKDTIDLTEYEDTIDSAQPAKAPLKLHIGKLNLKNSNIHYEDRTLFSKFNYDITAIRARGRELTLNGNNNLMISAHLPNGGSLRANWKGGLDVERSNARIVATLENVQLEDLSPFTEYMFAYPVKNGSMSLTSDNSIRQGHLNSNNIIDILNLDLGRKQRHSKAAYQSVPLKLGTKLMTDINGKININLPIHGNINSPKFKLRKIIGKAISNVFIKATAAPFVAIAHAHNIKQDNLTEMDIDMLIPDLTLSQYQKLGILASLMEQQPDVELIMSQQFNLSEAIERQAVFNLKKEYYTKDKDELEERLSLVDIENIKQIKSTNGDFSNFAKGLTGMHGSINKMAVNYYTEDSIRNQVLHRADRHNRFVFRYLTEQKGIDKNRVSVTTASEQELETCKTIPLYTIEAKIKE